MRLIVLDTNVIVSAAIRPDTAPATLVMDWLLEGRVQVATSPAIVREYREVARRPKFRRYGFPPLWLEFLIEESLFLPDADPDLPSVIHSPDPKDRPFLALAHTAGCWLVTGNLKHFPNTARNAVRVLSPADYLAHLETGSQ
ncbi:MAG: putative toxin-antitoxin system toxin component, PIN family [Acidobacteria bacterium]|nr:putative toxin-antitoxin system toxin component, PIN family [Acidobacteriota bacterium]